MTTDNDAIGDLRRVLIKYTDPQEPDEIIEIPGDWKMTFGPWAPRSGGAGPKAFTQAVVQNQPGWILRVYETKEKQRAVFTNVESFRDLSIPVFRRKIVVIPMGEDELRDEEVNIDLNDFVTINPGDEQEF